jgi:hypothetical protein
MEHARAGDGKRRKKKKRAKKLGTAIWPRVHGPLPSFLFPDWPFGNGE